MQQDKTKKSNSMKFVLAVIALIVIVVSAIALGSGANKSVYGKLSALKGTPSEIVDKAIINTFIQIAKEVDIANEEDGTKILEDILKSNIINNELELKYKDVKGLESLEAFQLGADINKTSEMISGIGLKFGFAYTNDLSYFKSAIDLIKEEDSIVNLDIYKSKDVLGISSSNLFENQYTIGLDNIFEEILKSNLYTELGGVPLSEVEKEEIQEVIKEMQEAFKQSLQPIISDECVAESIELFKKFVLGCEVEEKGKNGTLTKYVLKVDGKSAGEFITDEIELLLQQDYVKFQMQTNSVLDVDLDEIYEEIKAVFDEISVEVLFEVDEKYIRSMDINLRNKTYDGGVTVTVDLGKDKYLSSEVKAIVKVIDYEEEYEIVKVNYDSNFGNKEEVLTSTVKIEMIDPYEYMTIAFDLESKYDKSKDKDNSELNVLISVPDAVKLNISSIGTKKISKDEYSLQDNELTLNISDLQIGQNLGVVFELNMRASKGNKGDLEYKGEGKSVDILSTSVEDIDSLISEIQGNLMVLALSLLYL